MSLTQGTFRDPAGSLVEDGGRILRGIRPAQAEAFESLLQHDAVARLTARGALVATRPVPVQEVPEAMRALPAQWYCHPRVEFVSMPAEWSGAMLARAALHTLDVSEELIASGLLLKDATPANVLFDGPRPVFVDVPSIEPLQPGVSVWAARHQFETTFLLPLMALVELGLPLSWTLADPAKGLSHQQFAGLLGPRRWATVARIRHVALPAALERPASRVPPSGSVLAPARSRNDDARSRYILSRANASLRHAIDRCSRSITARASVWSNYESSRSHYSADDLQAKREFVSVALERVRPRWVLDVGANAGEFSMLAAKSARVVAIDLDEVPVSALYGRACAGGLDIQPLVVNLVEPTPACGWTNAERRSFLDRSSGRFDLAMMLAVGHHLRVTGGVPWEKILDTGLALGNGSLLVEFVPTSDPMFQSISRGRDFIYSDNSLDACESLMRARGRIVARRALANGRTLLLVQR